MRHGTAARRMRGRGGNNPGQQQGGGQGQRRGFQNKNRVFDSNGPDVRIRGTAYQIVEKYVTLAKDAGSAGDRVLAESYLQYAEHYQRIINSWDEEYGDSPAAYDTDSANAYNVPPPAGTAGLTNDSDEDDLSLPVSVLGGVSKRTSQVEAGEMADA
jgi:hypothetical protein